MRTGVPESRRISTLHDTLITLPLCLPFGPSGIGSEDPKTPHQSLPKGPLRRGLDSKLPMFSRPVPLNSLFVRTTSCHVWTHRAPLSFHPWKTLGVSSVHPSTPPSTLISESHRLTLSRCLRRMETSVRETRSCNDKEVWNLDLNRTD